MCSDHELANVALKAEVVRNPQTLQFAGVQVPPPAPPLPQWSQDGTILKCFGAGTGPLWPGTGLGI